MPRSMTAFARCEADTQWGRLICELRSVNHRYLDMALRLAEDLRQFEPEIRERIGKRLGRGKIDCNMRLQSKENATYDYEFDEKVLESVIALSQQVKNKVDDAPPLRTIDLLRWPGVLQAPELDVASLKTAMDQLLSQALNELVAMRDREGKRLGELISQRLDHMDEVIAGIREIIPTMVQSYRERLQEQLSTLKDQLDPARLEQEIVIFAQKTDVAEEIDRLESHISETRSILRQDKQIGRRLDFLMQEFNREANTLGSKAADIRLTNAAVELKVLIEQIREQVQNIE